jgi:predicted metalloendopeptidase
VAQKVGDLYSDYVDTDGIEKAGMKPVQGELQQIAALKTHEDVARYFAASMRLGGPSPFQYYVDQDEKDPERYLPHFYQSGLGLPDRDYYLVEDNARFATDEVGAAPPPMRVLGPGDVLDDDGEVGLRG